MDTNCSMDSGIGHEIMRFAEWEASIWLRVRANEDSGAVREQAPSILSVGTTAVRSAFE